MRKTDLLAAGLAATLALGSVVLPAAAYLTGNALATGTAPVAPLALSTTLNETVDEDSPVKHVTITADTDSAPVWVRVMVLQGETFGATIGGDGWTQDGDWWYYDSPLQPGETANELTVSVDNIPGGAKALADESFNVIVIHECAPVLYDEDGVEKEAKWDLPLDNGENQGEGE